MKRGGIMAKIVCIDKGTEKTGSAIGDVVAIHDEGTSLEGVGYATFKIISIPGTAKVVSAKLNALLPEMKRAFRAKAAADTWGFEQPEEAEFWKDGDDWRQIKDDPKYKINLAGLTSTDLDDLKTASKAGSALILSQRVKANVKEREDNQVSVAALKTVAEVATK